MFHVRSPALEIFGLWLKNTKLLIFIVKNLPVVKKLNAKTKWLAPQTSGFLMMKQKRTPELTC